MYKTCSPVMYQLRVHTTGVSFFNVFVSGAVTRVICSDSRHVGPRCYQLANSQTQKCYSQCAAGCTGPSSNNCNVSMSSG